MDDVGLDFRQTLQPLIAKPSTTNQALILARNSKDSIKFVENLVLVENFESK